MKDVSAATAKGHTVEAGRGVIDIPRFLRMLKKIGYCGNLSFEFEKDEHDPLPGVAETVGYVRGALIALRSNGSANEDVLVGRDKVFCHERRGFCEAIAKGKTFGRVELITVILAGRIDRRPGGISIVAAALGDARGCG